METIHDDVIYQILLWLPVISLLRFKLISRSWPSLIESSNFIKQHVHLHHYDPRLKDKNHSLIYRIPRDHPPIIFPSTSIESFEAPKICLQLDCPDVHEYFPVQVNDIVTVNGIVCLNLYGRGRKQIIYLWNPATKQSRLLSQSPFPLVEMKYHVYASTIGLGYDFKTNEYKVLNLVKYLQPDEKRVELYNLSTDSWRSVSTAFPSSNSFSILGMSFNSGTCFCWHGGYPDDRGILCFDFGSERFRSISFPDVDHRKFRLHLAVVSDRIACVFNVDNIASQTEIWVFTEYGSINETWVKLYNIDPYSRIDGTMSVVWLSMNGKYLFFKRKELMCRYDVVTKDIKNFPTFEEYQEIFKDIHPPSERLYYYFHEAVLEFKESLVPIAGK